MFKFPSCCITCQYFIPLYGRVIFHCVALFFFYLFYLSMFYLFFSRWTLGSLPLVWLFRTRCEHSRAGFMWTFIFSSLGCYTQEWDCWVVWKLCVQPEQPPNCFPEQLRHFAPRRRQRMRPSFLPVLTGTRTGGLSVTAIIKCGLVSVRRVTE